MKKITERLFKVALVAVLITVAFISFNGEYTFLDAGKVIRNYYGFQEWRYADQFPVGVSSLPVGEMPEVMNLAGGTGNTGAGDAIAIYVTPDVLPIACVALYAIAFAAMCLQALLNGLSELHRIAVRKMNMRPKVSPEQAYRPH